MELRLNLGQFLRADTEDIFSWIEATVRLYSANVDDKRFVEEKPKILKLLTQTDNH